MLIPIAASISVVNQSIRVDIQALHGLVQAWELQRSAELAGFLR